MTVFFKDKDGDYSMILLMGFMLFWFFVAYNVTYIVMDKEASLAFNALMLSFVFFPKLMKTYIENKFPHLKALVNEEE